MRTIPTRARLMATTMICGAAIRLGCDLSGRSAPLLARSRLAIDKGDLLLAAEPGYADLLLGEQTAKRAGALATILGLKLKITAL